MCSYTTQGHPLLDDIQGYKFFEFMAPLIDDMVQDDPDKRPTMDEVIQQFNALVTVKASANGNCVQ